MSPGEGAADEATWPVEPAVVPKFNWPGAYGPNNTKVDFGMEDFYCAPQNDHYKSVVFVGTTGWCPACPDMIKHVNSIQPQLEAAGMMVVYVTIQDRNRQPANHEYANEHINQLITPAAGGYRVGDANTLPTAQGIQFSPIITAYPSVWVVRKSDMRIITHQKLSRYLLPLLEIAQSPDSDWSSPGPPDSTNNGTSPGNDPNCGPEDEEIYESQGNDDPMSAPTIPEGTFEGGICNIGFDFFKIEGAGTYRVDIEFEHNVGDLDLFVWDFNGNEPRADVYSDSVTDNESIELTVTESDVVMISGYNMATTPYTFTLTKL